MNKTYLCLGAGPGIGLATALKFASMGFRIVLCARNAEKLNKLAEDIKNFSGQEVESCVADVGNYTQLCDLKNKIGAVDVLHFNAALIHEQNLLDESYENISKDITVGITGALYAIKTFAPEMLARKSGAILLTGGMLALYPVPEYLTLGVAKAGIRNMAEALFNDFRKNNVRIATVTVSAAIAPHSQEAKEVGELFWDIYVETENDWSWEKEYKGSQCNVTRH